MIKNIPNEVLTTSNTDFLIVKKNLHKCIKQVFEKFRTLLQ